MVEPTLDVSFAIKAEQHGFDAVFLGDHMSVTWSYLQNKTSELWVTLTAIGEKTKRVKLIPGVTDPFRRHPSVLAQAVATLDALTNGRAAIGLGAGEAVNLLPYGIDWRKPVTALKEAILVIRHLWAATEAKPASYNGQVFSLKEAFLMVKPVQKPFPPIYIGALGPKTLRVTGEVGDGWFPWINTPETFKQGIRILRESAEEAGRTLADIDTVALVYSAISEDYEKAYRAVEPAARMALVLERKILDSLGVHLDLPRQLTIQQSLATRTYSNLLHKAAERVPRKAVEAIGTIGDADDCIKKIEELIDAGATRIAVMNFGPDVEKTFEVYRDKIIPYFRRSS